VENLASTTRVSFDPGAVYCGMGWDKIQPLLRRADVLFVTTEELECLTTTDSVQEGASQLLKAGIPMIVVKMGVDGISLFTPGKTFFQPAVRPREVKDRTGAGDVAAAGFLAGMIESAELEDCLFLAAASASRSIEGYGRTTYPDKHFFVTELSKLKHAHASASEGAAR
jgi:sugar/nucleoside kinase (ribokinase family)